MSPEAYPYSFEQPRQPDQSFGTYPSLFLSAPPQPVSASYQMPCTYLASSTNPQPSSTAELIAAFLNGQASIVLDSPSPSLPPTNHILPPPQRPVEAYEIEQLFVQSQQEVIHQQQFPSSFLPFIQQQRHQPGSIEPCSSFPSPTFLHSHSHVPSPSSSSNLTIESPVLSELDLFALAPAFLPVDGHNGASDGALSLGGDLAYCQSKEGIESVPTLGPGGTSLYSGYSSDDGPTSPYQFNYDPEPVMIAQDTGGLASSSSFSSVEPFVFDSAVPEDPKKPHVCKVCRRGFARGFNLKTHEMTHMPDRPKPFACNHPSCNGRGFSRSHDLYRHQLGIHQEGPLFEKAMQRCGPGSKSKRRAIRGVSSSSLVDV